ncbi:MAG: hypothetical protein WAK82_21215 [Streptosporangiaceae bacterium]
MTRPAPRQDQPEPGPEQADAGATVSPWLGVMPEIVIAGVLVAATAVAGYLVAGWNGLAVVAVAATAIAMVVLRALLPQLTPDAAKTAREKPTARTLSGYSHRRFVVKTAMDSQGFYDHELRPVLEHLLAARLAERHGVNLYDYPHAARALLCRSARDADLWTWIDPAARPEDTPSRDYGHDRRGIPPRTLARLLDRLEKL